MAAAQRSVKTLYARRRSSDRRGMGVASCCGHICVHRPTLYGFCKVSSSTRRIVLVATLLAPICAAVPAEAARLVRQPYLQLMTTESVTVVWKTDVAARCSLALRPLGGATTVVSGSVGTTCVMALTGLEQGTEYGYVPRADGTALLAESVFHTDDPNAPFSFLVIGDSGTGGASQLAVRDRMRATPADFIVHTGDLVYDVGATAEFDP
jgi:hypothetical protein